ncbi:hypothetical protein TRFO_38099 [Tritrichomonas foetus]|uniref:RING-type domain-containing protein n=1 Tax=Tritrichomonas foetus TaxID=1144522 RepID=A0A1J4JDM0_9EUKA|nr:hypothetical protein TRFO_38099 [Tritrichomonas foetus]|eukprot:OHS95771.1 hypothetical protein TRFO_38099 [Tritrichomonas foetus]
MKTSANERIYRLLDNQQYLEAIKLCRALKISDQSVRARIEDEIAAAECAMKENDFKKAGEIFKTTIGVLEPSFVLTKFFENNQQKYLIDYLAELHIRGFATPGLTQLLFNLFVQAQSRESLHKFIDLISSAQTKKKQKRPPQSLQARIKAKKLGKIAEEEKENNFLQSFDINVAIEMLKKGGMGDEAIRLSQAVGISMTSISSLIDENKFIEAATQIFDHYDEPIGYTMLMKFGTQLLKLDASSSKIIEQCASLIWQTNVDSVDSDFIKLFWEYPELLYGFLKSIITEKPTELFGDTLISLLIPRPRANQNSLFGNPNIANAEEALNYINNNRIPINCANLLAICSECNFLIGAAQLLNRMGRASDALEMLIQENATNDIIRWILQMKPTLKEEDWYKLVILYSSEDGWSQLPQQSRIEFMQHVISNTGGVVPFTRILPLLMKNKEIPIEVLNNGPTELLYNLQLELDEARRERSAKVDLIEKMDNRIKTLESGVIDFEPTRYCMECREEIQPPYICFFCGHCVHSSCAVRGDYGKPICQTCVHGVKHEGKVRRNTDKLVDNVAFLKKFAPAAAASSTADGENQS